MDGLAERGKFTGKKAEKEEKQIAKRIGALIDLARAAYNDRPGVERRILNEAEKLAVGAAIDRLQRSKSVCNMDPDEFEGKMVTRGKLMARMVETARLEVPADVLGVFEELCAAIKQINGMNLSITSILDKAEPLVEGGEISEETKSEFLNSVLRIGIAGNEPEESAIDREQAPEAYQVIDRLGQLLSNDGLYKLDQIMKANKFAMLSEEVRWLPDQSVAMQDTERESVDNKTFEDDLASIILGHIEAVGEDVISLEALRALLEKGEGYENIDDETILIALEECAKSEGKKLVRTDDGMYKLETE